MKKLIFIYFISNVLTLSGQSILNNWIPLKKGLGKISAASIYDLYADQYNDKLIICGSFQEDGEGNPLSGIAIGMEINLIQLDLGHKETQLVGGLLDTKTYYIPAVVLILVLCSLFITGMNLYGEQFLMGLIKK